MALQIAFALYPILLAGVALYWTIAARPRGAFAWAVEIAASGSIVAFAVLTGPWAYTCYYLRTVLPVVFALAVIYAFRRARSADPLPGQKASRRFVTSAAILGVFALLDVLALASRVPPRDSLEVSFPLASGTYYVLQGGNSVITNPFHSFSGTELAFDIAALNAFGNRANGIAPGRLADYEIFGAVVYSPCDGIVVSTQDTLADNPPGMPDTRHPANHVTLKCGAAEVYMAHLMKGSVTVAAGQAVKSRQPLGKVGNSGFSLEPHLHIGAKRGGAEIGLVFDGRWLSMNSVVVP